MNEQLEQELDTLDISNEENLDQSIEVPVDFYSLPQKERNNIASQIYADLDETAKKAWSMGWRPKELWRGKNRDGSEQEFVDAEQFVENYENSAPIRNERTRKLATENEDLKRQVTEMAQKLDQIVTYSKSKEERDLEQVKNSIDYQLQQAKENLDVDKIEELVLKKAQIEKEKFIANQQPVSRETPQEIDPKFTKWHESNSWFGSDQEMTAMAQGFANQYGKGLAPEALLNVIDKQMRVFYPEEMAVYPTPREIFANNINRPIQPVIKMVENNSYSGFKSPAAAPRKKGYNDMPQEAKEVCKRIKQDPEKYAKLYWEGVERSKNNNKKSY